MANLLETVFFWQIATCIVGLLFLFTLFFIVYLKKKTHAFEEFRAFKKGKILGYFFNDKNRTVEVIPISPEAGTIETKKYGLHLLSGQGVYTDSLTKIPSVIFDADYSHDINVKAAKVADEMKFLASDPAQQFVLRKKLVSGALKNIENESINALKCNIMLSSIKTYLNYIGPHSMKARQDMVLSTRLRNLGNMNGMQIVLIFAAILGAIIAGVILIKMLVPGA